MVMVLRLLDRIVEALLDDERRKGTEAVRDGCAGQLADGIAPDRCHSGKLELRKLKWPSPPE